MTFMADDGYDGRTKSFDEYISIAEQKKADMMLRLIKIGMASTDAGKESMRYILRQYDQTIVRIKLQQLAVQMMSTDS